MKILLRNFRIVDESTDMNGSVLIEHGIIRDVMRTSGLVASDILIDGAELIPGRTAVLMPALVDLHAHFRDPGYPDKETVESACLAAAAGGYGTVVCMANTNPVIDTVEQVLALKKRAEALGLIDLYPVMALTNAMEGKILSGIRNLSPTDPALPKLLSEDGKDVCDDALLFASFQEARRLGIPVSCHCDAESPESKHAKQQGKAREVWTRIEENHATRRAIELGKKAQCHVHIAHVSTKEAVALIREAKAACLMGSTAEQGFTLTCEATPHHLGLTEAAANTLGAESWGRVNPPLRTEVDRQQLIEAILDGTIDAISTDHAPHTEADKAKGAPGFTGLETSFSVCLTELVRHDRLSLSRLSALMSAGPARILGLTDRGRILPDLRADLIIVDPEASWQVNPSFFKSRGKNSPFAGRSLSGTILMTMHQGAIRFAS